MVNVTLPAAELFTKAVNVPVVAVLALVTCVPDTIGVVVANLVTEIPLATMLPPVLSCAPAASNGALVNWLAVAIVTLL